MTIGSVLEVSSLAYTCSILEECDVQLYRQMGGVRDDLTIHEKALDVLIELLKKEQVGVANKYFHLCDVDVKLLHSTPCPTSPPLLAA